jgi:anti-sigma B factor antagonist
MALSVARREKEDIQILDIEGRITAGEEVAAFRKLVDDEIAAKHLRVVLNLGGVDYIDSTGLGSLVVCFTRLQKAGGMLKLLNLNRRHIELLVLTKLTTVFEVFDDEQDAVNSFFPDRKIKRFDILSFVQNRSGQ